MVGINEFFGDYYLLCNMKSEFVYVSVDNVEALALSKDFLVGKVFSKYP
jgi:hypothetical protein